MTVCKSKLATFMVLLALSLGAFVGLSKSLRAEENASWEMAEADEDSVAVPAEIEEEPTQEVADTPDDYTAPAEEENYEVGESDI